MKTLIFVMMLVGFGGTPVLADQGKPIQAELAVDPILANTAEPKNLEDIMRSRQLLLENINYQGHQKMGNDSGNGGGGVIGKGRPMTFYSAGFLIDPIEVREQDLNALAGIISFFRQTKYLSAKTKMKYVKALKPAWDRHYYKVKQDSFSPEIRARLIEEYARVTNIDKGALSLFAITDTSNGHTYLFPEFFQLKPVEQWAILFHEAYWMVYPNDTYYDVLNAELSFQAYFENGKTPQDLMRWVNFAGVDNDRLVASINHDLAHGYLDELIRYEEKVGSSGIDAFVLFGDKWLECHKREVVSSCIPFIYENISDLLVKYPQSLFLELVGESASNGQIGISFDRERVRSIDHSRRYESARVLRCMRFYEGMIKLDVIDGEMMTLPLLRSPWGRTCPNHFYEMSYETANFHLQLPVYEGEAPHWQQMKFIFYRGGIEADLAQ